MIFRESGKQTEEYPTLAVIGMDGIYGCTNGLDQIRDALYYGKRHTDQFHFGICDPYRIATEEISFAEFGFGFVDQLQTTPEQKTGLLVGLRSLKNAGIDLAELKKQRIAVLYASASGKQPISYRFDIESVEDHIKKPVNELEKILKMGGITGGIFDLSDFVSPLTAGIMLTEKLLINKKADLTILVSIGLNTSQPISHGDQESSVCAADGAGALVLQTSQVAERLHRRIYCQLQGVSVSNISLSSGNWLNPDESLVNNMRDVLEISSVGSAEIGVVEISRGFDPTTTQAEIESLRKVFAWNPKQKISTCAIGSVSTIFGKLGNAAEIASFIKATLQLSEKIIVNSRYWCEANDQDLWQESPFYIPENSRTWFARRSQPDRLAFLSLMQSRGTCTHILLSEAKHPALEHVIPTARLDSYLIPICGDDETELMQQRLYLQGSLLKSPNLAQLQHFWIRKWEKRNLPAYTAVFIGSSVADFLREVQFAEQGILKAIDKGGEWQTPGGSYFSAAPLGPEGKIAFVFPGGFNTQINTGIDLLYNFPELAQYASRITAKIGEVLFEEQLYPRMSLPMTQELQSELNQKLVDDPLVMLSSGTALATLYTSLLKDIFRIKPTMSFGYSLGENSMMFAAGIWNQGDAALQRLQQSPLFRDRISGRQEAIREYWQQQDGFELKSPLWANYVLMGDAQTLIKEIEKTPRVYVTLINTPRQVVIGGYPEACDQFIKLHKLNSIQAPFHHAMHCDPIRSEWQEFHRLHEWDVAQFPDQTLYSAAGYDKIEITSAGIANNIAEALTSPLDFPRLVSRVYEDGARIFIETGAGSNCSKWVDQILKKEAHFSMSINQHGMNDAASVLRVLARCVSHRVPVCLDALLTVQRQPQPVAVER
jgi:PfaB family protein